MARPPVDFRRATVDALSSVVELPQDSSTPHGHYRRSSADAWNLVGYMDRNVSRVNHHPAAFNRHMGRLRAMALFHTVGAFERFLKEAAAICIDHVADFVLDGRLDEFSLKGSIAGAHLGAGSLGRALCESRTWLDVKEINTRFRKVLADPFERGGRFYIFPGANQPPDDERFRMEIMAAIFQLRHTIVHNLGVLTRSDATDLRHILRTDVDSDKVFTPTTTDYRLLKRFVDETATSINERVATRLAELLTTMHAGGHLAFNAAGKAQELADTFGIEVTVAGETRSP